MLFDGKTYQDEYRFANVLDSLIASHVAADQCGVY
jgi:enterochelin esterase family protein